MFLFKETSQLLQALRFLYSPRSRLGNLYDERDLLLGHGMDNLWSLRISMALALMALVVLGYKLFCDPLFSNFIAFFLLFCGLCHYASIMPRAGSTDALNDEARRAGERYVRRSYLQGRILFTPSGLKLSWHAQPRGTAHRTGGGGDSGNSTVTASQAGAKAGVGTANPTSSTFTNASINNGISAAAAAASSSANSTTCSTASSKASSSASSWLHRVGVLVTPSTTQQQLLATTSDADDLPVVQSGFMMEHVADSLASFRVYAGVKLSLAQLMAINISQLPYISASAQQKLLPSQVCCLGFGFPWLPKHTRRLHELMEVGLRAAPFGKKGSPDLHGVEDRRAFEPILFSTELLLGHTLLLGTTGSGKTRFFDLLISQAIMRGDTVIIIDPKGDHSLQQTILRSVRFAGRNALDDIYCLDIGREHAQSLSSVQGQSFAQRASGLVTPLGAENQTDSGFKLVSTNDAQSIVELAHKVKANAHATPNLGVATDSLVPNADGQFLNAMNHTPATEKARQDGYLSSDTMTPMHIAINDAAHTAHTPLSTLPRPALKRNALNLNAADQAGNEGKAGNVATNAAGETAISATDNAASAGAVGAMEGMAAMDAIGPTGAVEAMETIGAIGTMETMVATAALNRSKVMASGEAVQGADAEAQESRWFFDQINTGFNPTSAFDRSTEIGDRLSAMMPGGGSSESFKAYANMAVSAAVECCILNGDKVSLEKIRSIVSHHESYGHAIRKYLNHRVIELNIPEVTIYYNRLYGIKNPLLQRNCYAVSLLLDANCEGKASSAKEQRVLKILEENGCLEPLDDIEPVSPDIANSPEPISDLASATPEPTAAAARSRPIIVNKDPPEITLVMPERTEPADPFETHAAIAAMAKSLRQDEQGLDGETNSDVTDLYGSDYSAEVKGVEALHSDKSLFNQQDSTHSSRYHSSSNKTGTRTKAKKAKTGAAANTAALTTTAVNTAPHDDSQAASVDDKESIASAKATSAANTAVTAPADSITTIAASTAASASANSTTDTSTTATTTTGKRRTSRRSKAAAASTSAEVASPSAGAARATAGVASAADVTSAASSASAFALSDSEMLADENSSDSTIGGKSSGRGGRGSRSGGVGGGSSSGSRNGGKGGAKTSDSASNSATAAPLSKLREFCTWLIEHKYVAKLPSLDQIFVMSDLNTEYYKKVTNGIMPYLSALTAGNMSGLLSSTDRSLPSFMDLIEHNKIFYVALHCLKDTATGQALGKLMIADLAFVAGELNAKGSTSHQRVSVFIDEAAELSSESLVQLLNKARASKFSITLATQCVADLSRRAGSLEAATQIIANCNNLISLRVNDPQSANVIASVLPQTVIASRSSSQSFSEGLALNDSYATSRMVSQKESELFPPSMLMQLPDFEYIARLANGIFYKGFIPLLYSPTSPANTASTATSAVATTTAASTRAATASPAITTSSPDSPADAVANAIATTTAATTAATDARGNIAATSGSDDIYQQSQLVDWGYQPFVPAAQDAAAADIFGEATAQLRKQLGLSPNLPIAPTLAQENKATAEATLFTYGANKHGGNNLGESTDLGDSRPLLEIQHTIFNGPYDSFIHTEFADSAYLNGEMAPDQSAGLASASAAHAINAAKTTHATNATHASNATDGDAAKCGLGDVAQQALLSKINKFDREYVAAHPEAAPADGPLKLVAQQHATAAQAMAASQGGAKSLWQRLLRGGCNLSVGLLKLVLTIFLSPAMLTCYRYLRECLGLFAVLLLISCCCNGLAAGESLVKSLQFLGDYIHAIVQVFVTGVYELDQQLTGNGSLWQRLEQVFHTYRGLWPMAVGMLCLGILSGQHFSLMAEMRHRSLMGLKKFTSLMGVPALVLYFLAGFMLCTSFVFCVDLSVFFAWILTFNVGFHTACFYTQHLK